MLSNPILSGYLDILYFVTTMYTYVTGKKDFFFGVFSVKL